MIFTDGFPFNYITLISWYPLASSTAWHTAGTDEAASAALKMSQLKWESLLRSCGHVANLCFFSLMYNILFLL